MTRTIVTGILCFPNGQPNGKPREPLPDWLVEIWTTKGKPDYQDATNPYREVREEVEIDNTDLHEHHEDAQVEVEFAQKVLASPLYSDEAKSLARSVIKQHDIISAARNMALNLQRSHILDADALEPVADYVRGPVMRLIDFLVSA